MKYLIQLCFVALLSVSAWAQPFADVTLAQPLEVASGAGGDPGPPSANLVQNLDGSTISGSDNDPIGTWTATVGKDATAAGDARPTLQTAERNGLNVLLFDGTDDSMETVAFDAPVTQPCTVFLVFKLNSTAANQRAISSRIEETLGARNFVYFENSPSYRAYGGVGVAAVFTATDPNTDWHVMSIEFNGLDTKARVDNATEEDNNPAIGGTGIFSGWQIGSDFDGTTHPLSGYLAQALLYTGTIADKTEHFTYLQDKWGF